MGSSLASRFKKIRNRNKSEKIRNSKQEQEWKKSKYVHRVSCFPLRFRISDFVLSPLVSYFGFRISSFPHPVSDFGFSAFPSGFVFRISDLVLSPSGFRFRISNFKLSPSGFEFRISFFPLWFRISDFEFRAFLYYYLR